MSDTAINAGFLTDLHQHWPFPSQLTDCTLVSACFTSRHSKLSYARIMVLHRHLLRENAKLSF